MNETCPLLFVVKHLHGKALVPCLKAVDTSELAIRTARARC